MNLLEILEKNKNIILTEAIKIENGKQALDLIKNKKIGVKVNGSYYSRSYTSDEDLIECFDKLINEVNPNDKVFIIQLAANKIKAHQLPLVVRNELNDLVEIVSCRNKPWAKTIPNYKEMITLNNDIEYNSYKWSMMAHKLQEESQKHGKHNKGSGNSGNVKILYNDDSWSLKVPTSWEGAKAISFYGKEGEEKSPCHWCTRADKNYYDHYTENNTKPLFIINDKKNGKAYQMSVGNDEINFLDQNDEKGDEITKGDLSKIPDAVLEKISWNGRNLKDFKNINLKIDEKDNKKIHRGNLFKDPTNDIGKARWGKPIKVTDDISKKTWLNFSTHRNDKDDMDDSINDYLASGKIPKSKKYLNHNGDYAEIYYYNKLSNIAFLLARYKASNDIDEVIVKKIGDKYKMEEYLDELEYSSKGESIKRIFNVTNLSMDKLIQVSSKDFGIVSRRTRADNRNHERDMKNKTQDNYFREMENIMLHKLQVPFNNYLSSKNFPVVATIERKYVNSDSGAFLPKYFKLTFYDKNNTSHKIGCIPLRRAKRTLKYELEKQSCDMASLFDVTSFLKLETNNFVSTLKEMIEAFNKNVPSYSREMMKNENGKKLRTDERSHSEVGSNDEEYNLHYEEYNYFDY